jgi:type II secretory ATPase GspE/PulE/Tfp pilus assembly ATPase PilB-like protein
MMGCMSLLDGASCFDCRIGSDRTAICGLLDLSDHIREMILERRPTSEIKKAAREEGMRFLREINNVTFDVNADVAIVSPGSTEFSD